MLQSKTVPMYKLFDETLTKFSRVTFIEVYHNKEIKFILCVHDLPDPSTGDSIAIVKYNLNVPKDINNRHVMPTFRLPWMFLYMKEETEKMQYAKLHDLVRTLVLKSLTLNGEFFKGKNFQTKPFGIRNPYCDGYGVETEKFEVLLRRSNQLHLPEIQRYYGYYQEVINCISEMNYETVNLAYNRSTDSGNKFNFKSFYNEVQLFFSRQMYT